MILFRLRIRPLSPWRTPWQSDTLSGLLCWACARRDGADVLQKEVLDPAKQGYPPFVISDAFPGDWFPMPVVARLMQWPAELRKQVKRCKYIDLDAFRRIQSGEPLTEKDLIYQDPCYDIVQQRNTIGRLSNTTGAAGSLFSEQSTVLKSDNGVMTIYTRLDAGYASRFLSLLSLVAESGFGADVSIGKWQFEIASDLEPVEFLDSVLDPNGIIVVSTFQPGRMDPTDGYWNAFTKYGKIGPDFGLENVFKRPMIMFLPGACFRTATPGPYVGRAIFAEELLALDVVSRFNSRGIGFVHLAFGLSVPLKWPDEKTRYDRWI